MQLFKKCVGRRNMVASEESCYQHQVKKVGGSSSYRPPALVTSTEFDDDDIFAAVARAMLFRYENEGLNERDTINATLVTSEDKRTFLESLDLRNATMYINNDVDDLEDSPINEIVHMTRSIFGETLKLMWRECITGYDGHGVESDEDIVGDSHDEYRHRLKTPKNNLHSPIGFLSAKSCSQSAYSLSLQPKSSGRQRRRFFSDSEQQPRCRTRIRLDFKLSGTVEPVQSLQLDGVAAPPVGAYDPPSPISSTVRSISPF